MDNGNEVTKEQIVRIMQLLGNGSVTYVAAQEFIDRHTPVASALTVYRTSPTGIVANPSDKLANMWEAAFPKRGIRVANMLRRFVEWTPKLAPPVKGLVNRAYAAFGPWVVLGGAIDINRKTGFWEQFIFSRYQWGVDPQVAIIALHSNALWKAHESLMRDQLDKIRDGCWQADGEFTQKLNESLSRTREELRIMLSLELTKLEEEFFEDELDNKRIHDLPRMAGLVERALLECLGQVCGLELAGRSEEAALYQPLLDLWLAGNFPLGVHASRAQMLVKF